MNGCATDVNTLAVTGQLLLDAARTLVGHLSQPLSDFAVEMIKHSQNLFAETLFHTLGSIEGDGSASASQVAVGEVLTAWATAPDQFVVADGSGLSRDNYLTAHLLVTVLDRMQRRSAGRFESTLPITGRDGKTLGFAILANNFAVPPGRITTVIDCVVERLANFAR